jgi:hypothetical protein
MEGRRSKEGGKTVQRNVNGPEEIIVVQKVLLARHQYTGPYGLLFPLIVFVGVVTPPLFSHNLVLWLSYQ